jgi:glutamate dehydrogenase (NAD(P)+)
MSEPAFNPFTQAQAQLDRVAELMGLDEATRQLLRAPSHEHSFTMPIRMDNGRVKVLHGYRVQHNDARGPAWGGVRFHPMETIDTIRALAMWMTWKTAAVDIPLGGSMGGVICDPHNLSTFEQERICRAWIRRIARNIGPLRDVPAPDVMTYGQHMTWMLDEYEAIAGSHQPGSISGKPVKAGGSWGRIQATGYGLVYLLREALKEVGLEPQRTTASVQGFGQVAQHAIELYHQIGGKVVCVSTWDHADRSAYAFRRPEGIDLEQLRSVSDRFGGIDRSRAEQLGYEVLDGDAWLAQEVDILIPAALENQITSDNVEQISRDVKIIAEGANGPTSPEAEAALEDRGVFMIPDLLANAGGVVCSYFEQVQCNMNYYWRLSEVLSKLDMKLTDAYLEIAELRRKKKLQMRDATMVIAVDRVVALCHERGWV